MAGELLRGFPPICDDAAQVLVLGSMPGVASLDKAEYYGHPRNAFWPIMAKLCGFALQESYAQRCQSLRRAGIALWDVIGQCRRQGSLDSAIEPDSVQVNPLATLLHRHPGLRRICFNGRKAEQLFRHHVLTQVSDLQLDFHVCPSTSPAYAALRFDDKYERWKQALDGLCPAK